MYSQYDSRGRLLDEPDDIPSCRHGEPADRCRHCRAEYEEEQAYLARERDGLGHRA